MSAFDPTFAQLDNFRPNRGYGFESFLRRYANQSSLCVSPACYAVTMRGKMSINPTRVKQIPPLATKGCWRGDFFARGAHTFRVYPHVPIVGIKFRPGPRNPSARVFLYCDGRGGFFARGTHTFRVYRARTFRVC